ncbi:MAG: flagellar hook-basal body complex protein FliE [Bdellovibrionales bacterium]
MVANVAGALSAYRQASSVPTSGAGAVNGTSSGGGSFSDMVSDFLGDTVDSVRHSEEMSAKGAMGKADLQDVILAVSDAEVMIQTVTAIRDKMISAYQEVIRTAI